jgi:hypothetical protein
MNNQLGRRNLGKKNTAAPIAFAPALEPMESRQMLSAAISHGVLSIDGTGRADTIVLTMDSPRTLRVRVGDAESTFLKKSIGKIRINAGRGMTWSPSAATPTRSPSPST